MKNSTTYSSVALIPARMGSQRIKHKNIINFDGHPLIAYTIRAAIESKVFERVICATDSPEYAEIAIHYGAEVPFLRDRDISSSNSPDIEWVSYTLQRLKENLSPFDIFSILRPTSPFRTSDTIIRAYNHFLANNSADSLRGVEKCSQHPGKMWILQGNFMNPLMPFKVNETYWHSNQYSALPDVYVQNASIEIAWVQTVELLKSISGDIVLPFLTENFEGFDINYPEDLDLANLICQKNPEACREIKLSSYFN